MVLVLLVGANIFFKISKKENYRESIKFIMRALAIIQYLYASFLAVPFMTLLFQTFNCDEDPLL
jgi:hypothetical protein